MLLEGRRAIVTGGSTGIGKATAQRLVAEGASVCVNYYSEKEADGAQKFVAELMGSGSGSGSGSAKAIA
ncbi:MAG: SDR family NAD(P)-dependent oxidoreductase, partial [Solirubrobacteraceae bacterium]